MNSVRKHTGDLIWLSVILVFISAISEVGSSIWGESKGRLLQTLSGYTVIFGLLGIIWFYEARLTAKCPYGSVTLAFVILTSLLGLLPIIELVEIPSGSVFDSFRWYTFQMIVWTNGYIVGIVLGIRAMIRGQAGQKLLGLVSVVAALVLPTIGHSITRSIIDSRNLTDLW